MEMGWLILVVVVIAIVLVETEIFEINQSMEKLVKWMGEMDKWNI